MSIKINLHPGLQQFTDDQAIIEVNGSTVGQCLDDLVKQFPKIRQGLFGKDGKLLNYVDIYVNMESAYPEELAKPVKDNDELHITLIIAGG
ncbi:MAG: MoaD/ThiS family protein [Dehalococcoidia bacterium]|nr:MoaD/ThiS family protein [Dehalococcoidia bacterium]